MNSTDETEQFAGGFAAGTLVHTDKGPVPIENIQIGDLVLSLLEPTGEQAYKRVLNTIDHADKHVILVSYIVDDKLPTHHIVVAADQPFWVQGRGWLPADRMEAEFVQTHDGRETYVYLAYALFKTEREGFGWTCHRGSQEGTEVDLRGARIEIVSENSLNGEDSGAWGFVTMTVFNLEVESPGSYCVCDAAVRVAGSAFVR